MAGFDLNLFSEFNFHFVTLSLESSFCQSESFVFTPVLSVNAE